MKKYDVIFGILSLVCLVVFLILHRVKIIDDIYIGIVISLLISFLPILYKIITRRIQFIGERFSPSEIMPHHIMRDGRGEEEFGFNKSLYYKREIDGELRNFLRGNSKIIVVSGGIGSGKSRAIYQYVISEDCQRRFNHIYVVTQDNIESICLNIKSCRKKSLVIVDDIHVFYYEKRNSLFELLRIVYDNQRLKAIVTIATENEIDLIEDYESFYSYINTTDIVRKKNSRGIEDLKIPDIIFGDDVHDWCLANLCKANFSPVIGAYIKPLEREILNKTKELLNNQDAVDVLTAYSSIIKFRKDKGQYIQYVFLMYIAQSSDGTRKTLKNFNDGLKILVKLGYMRNLKAMILQYTDGRRVGEDETLSTITQLIEKDRIDWDSVNEKIEVNDQYLYNAFQTQAALGDELKNATINLYLSHGKDSEINQVKALIRIDKNDPNYYARAITKSIHTEAVIKVINELMLKHLFVQSSAGVFQVNESTIYGEEKIDDLTRLIGIIIGRAKFKHVDDYQKEVEKYNQMGVAPNISTVGELLRIALLNPSFRDEMRTYTNSLLVEYNLTPDVYYYQRIEELERDYDLERIRKAYECRQDTIEGVKSFQIYCNVILKKAKTPEKIDLLFDTILPEIDGDMPHVITFKRNAILYLISNFMSTRYKSKSDILVHFLEKLKSYPRRISENENIYNSSERNYDLKNIFIEAIKKCGEFSKAKQVYEMGLSILNNEETDNKYQRLLALSLFGQIGGIEDFNTCNEILLQLKDEIATDADLKLFNKLLSNSPFYEQAEMLFNTAGTINNKCDIYTINALLNVAKKSFKNSDYQRWVDEALKIEAYRAEKNIPVNPFYVSHFYDMAEKLINEDKTEDISFEKIKTILGNNVKVNNYVLEAQRIKILTTSEEVSAKANSVLQEMQNGKAVDSDICTALLEKAEQFGTTGLLKIIDEIINNEEKINRPSVHYYCNRFKYQLSHNKYSPKGVIDMNLLKNDIEKALTHLLRIGENLFEKRSDIFLTIINILDFDNASDIVSFAKNMSEKLSKFEIIFRSELIILLCTRIKIENPICKEQINKVQLFINNNPNIRFNEYQRRTLSSIARRTGSFIYYPLTNKNRQVRHYCWDKKIEDGIIQNSYENDIQTFIKLEVYDIACNLDKQEEIDANRLIQALEVLSEKTDQLDDFINTDGFLYNPYRPTRTNQYKHFFDAFNDLYHFQPKGKEKWRDMASFFGHTTMA